MKDQKHNKKQVVIFLAVIIFAALFFGSPAKASTTAATTTATSTNPFQYQLLEAFPGFYAANATPNFPSFILALYKFGIWTVGIAGLFMLTIGGFMYMSSAGNTATASKAKGVIEDAIIGIIAAMCAYLILYIINPDLTKLTLTFIPVNVTTPAAVNNTVSPATGTGVGAKVVAAAEALKQSGNCNYCNVSLQTNSIVKSETKGSGPCQLNQCKGSPGFTDCSDFVRTVTKSAGCKNAPTGSATQMFNSGQVISGGSASLKAGDILAIVYTESGKQHAHVVICMSDGCGTVVQASGTVKGLTDTSSGSYYLGKGAKVIPAASYCGS